ncbi:hypothetical protein NQ318_016586 [Aromia moschata]|uniref:Retrotransposon gag domain-containing protein n=1 Tax=Aromia moschata TaxID=1265417 RepID=A0AAV8YZF2_9CUCU|nr:hypothetical protein NQ318_016586 [Aromia moschata]
MMMDKNKAMEGDQVIEVIQRAIRPYKGMQTYTVTRKREIQIPPAVTVRIVLRKIAGTPLGPRRPDEAPSIARDAGRIPERRRWEGATRTMRRPQASGLTVRLTVRRRDPKLGKIAASDSGDYSNSPDTPLQHSSLTHAERSVHKILKPPTYDGQSSWSMYRRHFEAAAKANGWTSQEMATSLVISLRCQALEILQSIPEEQQNDYDRIVGALEIRYGHKYLRQVYQYQIKSRQQRTNESLQEYESDIERLIHVAYPQAPKEFLEQIGIQSFIDGLLDTEMQQALRLGRHTTVLG